MAIPIEHGKERWEKLIFSFGDKWILRASIKKQTDSTKMLLSNLPLETEALVIDEAEILIKLPPTLRTSIRKRVHSAEAGDIIYRPQIPAMSIFADYMDLYEPVENIGLVDSRDRDVLLNLARNEKSLMFIKIALASTSI